MSDVKATPPARQASTVHGNAATSTMAPSQDILRVAYIDCVGGVAGDMLLAALVDAGANEARLKSLPSRLGLGKDVTVSSEARRAHGFAARQVTVAFDPNAHPASRDLAGVTRLIERGALDDAVRERSLAAFQRLAAAEAKVHGATLETVHFHEVGAVDAIVDIVGVCELVADLRLDKLRASALPMGRGFINSAHGRLPLPAPAVLAMLDGVPIYDVAIEGETVTPTGLALLRELCAAGGFGPLEAMTVQSTGVGRGSLERPDHPNLVRLIVGEAPREAKASGFGASQDTLVVLECALDDLDPRLMPRLFEALYEAGALDVLALPALMKKGRPGQLIQVLSHDATRAALAAVLFRESTTLGVRWYPVAREHLARREDRVLTPWGEVAIKVALDGEGRPLRGVPEHESCAEVARQAGQSLQRVVATAQAAWMATLDSST
ncbi:MAG: nickel pincer cofactor biosynthesis protein LarC [Deltaproteobacteria bacterium]|nr:nickel pincer cofactor biosynthesis protein LarC [Deltaproteobacteria bacterium]